MRQRWLALIIGCVVAGTSSAASAHIRGPRLAHRPRVVVARPYVGYYGYPGIGVSNPYSVHFVSPNPHWYGRWDLYFNMHGAPWGF